MNVPAGPPGSVPDRTLSVVSLNIAKESDAGKIVTAIRNAPRLCEADLFLFQEVAHDKSNLSVAEEAARELGYFVSFEAVSPGIHGQGLAVISRYPIHDVRVRHLKACDLRFRCRTRFAISATVRTPWRDLRIWNAHLDTRINAEERLEQLAPVIDDASRHTGPRLIAGDFNTNDLYWLRNVVPLPGGPSHGVAIRIAMKRHGFETAFPHGLRTFPRFRRHLDWIFTSELSFLETGVEPARFSDHNAIWARVRFKEIDGPHNATL